MNTDTYNTTAAKTIRIPKAIEIVTADTPNKRDLKAILAKHKDDPKACVEALKASARENGHLSDAEQFLGKAVDASRMIASPKPKPPELIKGALHRGCRLMITGGAKSYKTWLLIRLAECISEGLPWLGMETVEGKVLYLNFELPDYLMDERMKMIHDELLPNVPKESERLKVINVDEVNCTAKSFLLLIPELAKEIKKQNIALIIVDPIYSLYQEGQDENSASDMALILNQLKRLANESGASIAYTHHHTKGSQGKKDAFDRSSGSGVFKRHADSIIDFTELEPENDKCEDFVMEFKLRGFKRMAKKGIRIIDGYKVVLDSTLKLDKIKDPSKFQPIYKTDSIVDHLKIQRYKSGDLKRTVIGDTGMSGATFDRLWQAVREVKEVKQDKEGYWTYSLDLSKPIQPVTKTATSK